MNILNKPQNIISFTTGTLSNALDICPRMLQIYDKEGILTPKRTKGNRRYYTYEDYQKALLILFLTRNFGVNLAGVKIIISLLKKYEIKEKDYINELTKTAKIDTEKQKENILKAKRKGRRKLNNE